MKTLSHCEINFCTNKLAQSHQVKSYILNMCEDCKILHSEEQELSADATLYLEELNAGYPEYEY
jgi:hypothetical protein